MRNNLVKTLWLKHNELKGNMNVDEFRNYYFGLIFYKYLSEKIEFELNKLLKDKNIDFDNAYENEEYKKELEDYAIKKLGYFIQPKYLFNQTVKKIKNKYYIWDGVNRENYIINDLNKALKEIENSSKGQESENDFINIFKGIDSKSENSDKNRLISKILLYLSEIDFNLANQETNKNMDTKDSLGDAFEYLISQFALNISKKPDDFYTPKQVSKLLAKLATINKKNIKTAYDPCCGSASLLLRVGKEVNVSDFYGQELNMANYNLARMNMLVNNVNYDNFDIQQGDALENPKYLDKKFEIIVSNPPFSIKWSADKTFLDDVRFKEYGKLAPKSKADFAFIQDMIYHLDDNGTMVVILPYGVLFRGINEGIIRKYIIEEKNCLDAVIGLPNNIFTGTSIYTVVLVFRKNRENKDNIFFIDSSKNFEKIKNRTILTDEFINKIINTYKKRGEIENYSHIASLNEIKENDYNLNISRYINNFKGEELDEKEILNKINDANSEIKEIDKKIEEYCIQLNIKKPFFIDMDK
ncbi:MAG: type I restriction-modification system subunit M [Methanobrevibacter sp.]|jgi:type I restriction enzyme M protein|nr:type I restriction-modification system subunit M [Methanobrevibacter sp.]